MLSVRKNFLFLRDWENFFAWFISKVFFFPILLSYISYIYPTCTVFSLVFNLDLSVFQKKCHVCLMKPQGNDNASYSPKMVTCLTFYLVIQFSFGGTDMHDILEFCPFLNFNPLPQKTCFQLHDHPIAWTSPPTSISLNCSYSYRHVRSMNCTNLTVYRLHWWRPPKLKIGLLSFTILSESLSSLSKGEHFEHCLMLLKGRD